MTHTALVKVYHHGDVVEAGGPVDYTGPSDWKYRPNDQAARRAWEIDTAQPERVDAMNLGHADAERPA